MFSDDINDILGDPPRTPDSKSLHSPCLINPLSKRSSGRKTAQLKRPDGMSLEAYRLFSGLWSSESQEIISSVMPSNDMGYKKNKARMMGSTGVHKFKWTPFMNEARKDGLQLFHWTREDRLGQPYPFARFNKVLEFPTYTDDQYDKYLKIKRWTKEETDHLFDLCQRFDLRWPIVHDRFDRTKFSNRSIEDLKERYYSVVDALIKLRVPPLIIISIVLQNPDDVGIAFDVDHERVRKDQLEKQWNRTPEQLMEEGELLVQLAQINSAKRAREQRAKEVNKFFGELYQTEMSKQSARQRTDSQSSDSSFKIPRQTLRKGQRLKAGSDSVMPKDSEDAILRFFRVPDFKAAGPHLRTQEILQVKGRLHNKREKSIAFLMQMNRLEIRCAPGTEEIAQLYNEFKKSVIILATLKESLVAAEIELHVLKEKADREGKVLNIPPKMLVSTIPETGLQAEQLTGEPDAPTSLRRLTAVVDKIDFEMDRSQMPVVSPELFIR